EVTLRQTLTTSGRELLQRLLACVLQLRVQVIAALLALLLLDVEEVEQRIQDLKVPLGLAGLDLHDLAGACALDRMSAEVANVPHRVEILAELARQDAGFEHLLDLVVEVLALSASFLDQQRLQAAAAQSSAASGTVCQDGCRLSVVVGDRLWQCR